MRFPRFRFGVAASLLLPFAVWEEKSGVGSPDV